MKRKIWIIVGILIILGIIGMIIYNPFKEIILSPYGGYLFTSKGAGTIITFGPLK